MTYECVCIVRRLACVPVACSRSLQPKKTHRNKPRSDGAEHRSKTRRWKLIIFIEREPQFHRSGAYAQILKSRRFFHFFSFDFARLVNCWRKLQPEKLKFKGYSCFTLSKADVWTHKNTGERLLLTNTDWKIVFYETIRPRTSLAERLLWVPHGEPTKLKG